MVNSFFRLATQNRGIQLHVRYDIDAGAAQAEAASDGCFPLTTNDRKLTSEELLTAYKYQPQLEQRYEEQYLDGHFLPCTGSRATSGKGYSTLRRLPLPGHHQTRAHDVKGHPLWVDEGDGDVSFYATLVQVSTRVKQWYPEQRILVAFDRGGVSKESTAALVANGIDFVWLRQAARRAGDAQMGVDYRSARRG